MTRPQCQIGHHNALFTVERPHDNTITDHFAVHPEPGVAGSLLVSEANVVPPPGEHVAIIQPPPEDSSPAKDVASERAPSVEPKAHPVTSTPVVEDWTGKPWQARKEKVGSCLPFYSQVQKVHSPNLYREMYK